MKKDLEKLIITKEIFDDKYDEFVDVVSNAQTKIKEISTLPIDNYTNNIICDKDLLKYIYQNIRYYFDVNNMYLPKISEGMAIFVSKAIILKCNNIENLRQYFSRGNYNMDKCLANPFEEISRLLINSIVIDGKRELGDNSFTTTLKWIEAEDKVIMEGLKSAVTKEGVFNKLISCKYTASNNYDNYINIGFDLEISNINSKQVMSATTSDNKDVILTQLGRIVDIYHSKLSVEQFLNGFPTQEMSNRLKKQFENKVLYAKRNIGVYEKTKQLVKSQN